MLVQTALVVFALLAMLSLVVDIGYARLTQAQMQNAADTAALEGLRLRDAGTDPAASDLDRRTAANRLVHWTFDDDFNTTNGDPDYQFGAGPIIDLTDGAGSLHAYQTMSVPDPHVYKPDIQLNQQNEVYGDQVSGRFCYSADPAPSEDALYGQPGAIVCNSPQTAVGPYTRNDFNPGVDDSAFLVRLRRSTEFQGASGQIEPDIASSGPSLPLIFGKGTMIRGDDPQSSYSARRDGLTVRATAIAAARPALHVGLPQPQATPPLPGVTPFALRDINLPGAGASAAVTICATGYIFSGASTTGTCPTNAGNSIGRFVGDPADPTMSGWTSFSTVGRCFPGAVPCVPAVPTVVPVACASITTIAGYTPVYSPINASATAPNPSIRRIVGFAPIILTRRAPCVAGAAAFTAQLARGPSAVVAPSNATASLFNGLPLPGDVQAAELAELLDRYLMRNGLPNYGPVLVPVLAR